jgi:hypothetical protein
MVGEGWGGGDWGWEGLDDRSRVEGEILEVGKGWMVGVG